MNKIVLLTILSLTTLTLSFSQNNGGGCRKAIVLTPGTYTLDTFVTGAATYSNFFPFPGKAKWYKYTPTADGLMTISSCEGGSDTRLFLYQGSCDTLIQAGYNDDFCFVDPVSNDKYAASISKPVKANKSYFFEWDNAWDDSPFVFTLSFSAFTPTTTQTCETASTIAPGLIRVDSLFGYASRGDGNRANWYKYTPSKNGRLSISTCGQDADTRIWMYRGICTNLTLVSSSDDDCLSSSNDTIAATISNQLVTAGTTYYFEWDDTWENVPFSFLLTFDAANGVAEEQLQQHVVMSPNPASSILNFDMSFDKTTDINLRILNHLGQSVFTQKMNNILRGSQNIDLSALISGIYIVEISDGQTRVNKKLVINR